MKIRYWANVSHSRVVHLDFIDCGYILHSMSYGPYHAIEEHYLRILFCDCGAQIPYNTRTGSNVRYQLGELTVHCPECLEWRIIGQTHTEPSPSHRLANA